MGSLPVADEKNDATSKHMSSHTLAELQEIAKEYNEKHRPIPLKQPKAALLAQLEQRGAMAEEDGQNTVAALVDAVAREAAVWALKMEDRRRHYEREGRRRRRGRTRTRSPRPWERPIREEGAGDGTAS
jgi:hypothetical protein